MKGAVRYSLRLLHEERALGRASLTGDLGVGTYGTLSAARARAGTLVPNSLPIWQLERCKPFRPTGHYDGENSLRNGCFCRVHFHL